MKQLLLISILFLLPTYGFGHAHLKSSDPAKDAVLHNLPHKVVLLFSEDLELPMCKVEVTNQKTHDVVSVGSLANNDHKKNTLEVELKAPSQESATYEVSWKAVGTDSHPMKGSYAFSVAPGGK